MRRLVLLLLVLLALPAGAAPRAGFGWPLAGTPTVTRGFQPPPSAWAAGHRGVDLAGALGQAVLAAGPGRVTYAGVLAGRGVVTVTHDGGLRTTYEPVSASVHLGQVVVHGTVLGRLGTGHASCGGSTCLHWGLLRGDTYLDPLGLITSPELRLLPVQAPAPVSAPLHSSSAVRAGRGLGAVAAVGSLALGVSLLASRTRPTPQPPPVDLRAERARRRAA